MAPIFENDLQVLNYALTAEHLENTFYKMAVASGKLQGNAAKYFAVISNDEQAHVDAITKGIQGAGGVPVKPRRNYFFDKLGDMSTATGLITIASKLTSVGIAAYNGAAREIMDKTILGVAGSIVAVEARHIGIIRVLLDANANPVPKSFEDVFRPSQVLSIVGPLLGPGADQKPADADMQEVIDQLVATGPPTYTLTPAEARAARTARDATLAVAQRKGLSTTPEPVAKVQDITIPGPVSLLPARVYTPAGAGPFPVLVYFHGGGWVIANKDVYDASARGLTNGARAVVISVDYRQGPENRFPAAHDDAYAAYKWALANAARYGGDPARVAVGGESAGGNLSFSICLRARTDGVKQPVYQLLVYPVAKISTDAASYIENGDSVPLSTNDVLWFARYYRSTMADDTNPIFSPLNASNFAGLAPATVITAELDPLRDHGEELAQRLRAAGVAVKSMRYTGVSHEFFGMALVVAKAKQAVAMASADLRAAFGN